jgi:hypothetical protein
MFRALLCPSSGAPSNCLCSLWLKYGCRVGRVSSCGRFTSVLVYCNVFRRFGFVEYLHGICLYAYIIYLCVCVRGVLGLFTFTNMFFNILVYLNVKVSVFESVKKGHELDYITSKLINNILNMALKLKNT